MKEPAYTFYRVYYKNGTDTLLQEVDFDSKQNAQRYIEFLKRYPHVFRYYGLSKCYAYIEPDNGRIHRVLKVIE